MVLVDGVNPNVAIKVLDFCRREINFGAIKLFSFNIPDNFEKFFSGINFIQIEKLDYFGYNDFIISRLVNYINCDYVLIVQTDGFIANPNNWREEFFSYDYIGAPWDDRLQAHYPYGSRVGNGGFSFRSKHFLEIVAQNITNYDLNKQNGLNKNEDFFLCKTNGDFLKMLGIKIAPEDVAANFSIEEPYGEHFDISNTFGFHGFHPWTKNLIDKVLN